MRDRYGRRGPRPVSAVLVSAAVAAGMAVPPAGAQDESSPPEDVVLFIVDLSGSMNEDFGDGRTKLDVAKAAFRVAFEDLPAVPVGLRVYGDQLASRAPAARQENCETDTRLVEPIGEGNRAALISQAAGFTAQGDTPIALALQEAANNDIPEGARATIVLFSDGRDECHDADLDGDPNVGPSWGPDPCDVAKDLASAGADVRISKINTIGFRAGDAAAQLQCIAESTGGTYIPAETEDDVRGAIIEQGSPREAERLGGEPIEGTPTDDAAPILERVAPGESNRRYTDSVALNEERWYLATDYGPGEGHTTATVFDLPKIDGITLELRMEAGPGENLSSNIVRTREVELLSASDSVRCGGCYIAGSDAHQLYFVVVVRTDDPEILSAHGEDSFDLELLLEETAWGGPITGCLEGNVCWYESQIEAAEQRVAQLEEQLLGGDDLAPLQDEIDGLEAEVASVRSQRQDLEAGPSERTSWALPILLALVTIAAGGAWFVLTRRERPVTAATGEVPAETTAVIGTLDLGSATAGAPSEQAGPVERRQEVTEGALAGREVPEGAPAGLEVPEVDLTDPEER